MWGVKNNFFKNKKIYYFNVFPSEKHFEKQLLPHFQTPSSVVVAFMILDLKSKFKENHKLYFFLN